MDYGLSDSSELMHQTFLMHFNNGLAFCVLRIFLFKHCYMAKHFLMIARLVRCKLHFVVLVVLVQ